MDLNALNNGFGPLYRTRNEKVLYGIAFSAIVVLISLVEAAVSLKVFCYSDTDNIHLVSTYCAMASSLILGEIIRRLTLFTEEVRHVNERYNGSKLRAFQKCLTFGNKTKVCFTFYFSLAVYNFISSLLTKCLLSTVYLRFLIISKIRVWSSSYTVYFLLILAHYKRIKNQKTFQKSY